MNKAENNNNKKMYISPIAENKKYIIYRTLIASSFNTKYSTMEIVAKNITTAL